VPRPVVVLAEGLDQYQGRLVRSMSAHFGERSIPLLVLVNDHEPGAAPSAALGHALWLARPLGVLRFVGTHPADADLIEALLAPLEVPQVTLGFELPDRSCVLGDNRSGMRELMRHLIVDRGIRRPVWLRGIASQPDSVQREEVFRTELAEHGIPVDEDLVLDGAFAHGISYQAVTSLVTRRRDFDAVVAANDISALAAIEALGDAGMNVPRGVAVTGFDNDSTGTLRWPSLTTVDQDVEAQGHAAAQLMLEHLDGRHEPRRVVVPSRALLRGTSARVDQIPSEQLSQAIATARAVHDEFTQRYPLQAIHTALARALTLDDVVAPLTRNLPRVGVRRCFVAIRDPVGTDVLLPAPAAVGTRPPETADTPDETPMRLVLVLRQDQAHPPDDGCFPASALLPEQLAPQLCRDTLFLLPIWVPGAEVGHVLYEQPTGPLGLVWTLRVDLTQALDAHRNDLRLQERAATLQRVVAERTHQLESEVAIRRQAEHALQGANTELRRLVRQDGLTGIANRAAFEEYLAVCGEELSRQPTSLALLLVDVDLFKAYNDYYGHVRGDEALRTVARCLGLSAREPRDLVARFGGEEFVALLPGGSAQSAVAVTRRFRTLLAAHAVPHAASTVAGVVTASVGIAVSTPDRPLSPETLLTRADEALYRAKSLGRDRAVLARPGAAGAGMATVQGPGPWSAR